MPEKSNGRFRKDLDREASEFSSSLKTDFRMYREDIEGSIVHARMLGKQKIISQKDMSSIVHALQEILEDFADGKLTLTKLLLNRNRFSADDIHMAIESRLISKIKDIGGRLHTARSRNDQVQLDERLYLRRQINAIVKLISAFQKTLLGKANVNFGVIMPGYTHLQQAQPILLSHHLLAYVSMLERDKERLKDCLKRVNKNPLGAGALAGTSFDIDRDYTSKLLRFDGLVLNSMDAVGDRDVHIEFIASCSIIMMHLSRLAEELVIWSSLEWDFAEIGEEYTTGSSMMPQKKNPDIAEIVRGKTGRVYGSLVNLLTVMKALPLAYNRDMQEDKEPLFDTIDTVSGCLYIFSRMMKTVKFNSNAFYNEESSDHFLATDIADYLVSKKMPFRNAHNVTGSIVRHCISNKKNLCDLKLEEFRRFSPLFNIEITNLLNAKESLNRKKSAGSTSPKEVRKAITYWKNKLK